MLDYVVCVRHDDERLKKNIGHNIEGYRSNVMQINREEMMEKLGCSFYTIENIETGRSFPNFEMLKRLTNVSNIPIYYFVMLDYELNVDYSYRELMSGYTEAEQIQILMYTQCEKYHMLYAYHEGMIQAMNSKEGVINYETIGYLIRFERIKRGLSPKELAEKIHCTEKSLNNIETGNGKVSFKMLLCICHVLHVPMDYFLISCLENKKNAINYMLVDIFENVNEKMKDYFRRFVSLLQYKIDIEKEAPKEEIKEKFGYKKIT